MNPQEQRIIASRPFRMSSLMSPDIEKMAAANIIATVQREGHRPKALTFPPNTDSVVTAKAAQDNEVRDADILDAIRLNPGIASVNAIARLLPYRPEMVRHRVSTMERAGIIIRVCLNDKRTWSIVGKKK